MNATPPSSPHETRARAVRVAGLELALNRLSVFRGSPVRAVDLLAYPESSWELLALNAGITTPSTTTRSALIERVAERDARVASNNAELARLAARR